MMNNIVGDNIRLLRESLNLTQEALALQCGLTQGHINYIENGKRGYTKQSLTKIAKALGVTVSRLFEEEGGKTPVGVSEPNVTYGRRRRVYEEIIALLEKLPDAVVNHYRMILEAEVSMMNKG